MDYVAPLGGAPGAPYVDHNPGLGVAGSIPPAAAIEHAMREIVAVITGAGLTPNGAILTQLRDAITAMISSGGVADISSYRTVTSGPLTAPPGSPAVGDEVLVADSPTGAFASQARKIARYTGSAWSFAGVRAGRVFRVNNTDTYHTLNAATGWQSWTLPISLIAGLQAALDAKAGLGANNFSAQQTISGNWPTFLLDKNSGTGGQVAAAQSGLLRWVLRLANEAVEAGGNVGSNFDLLRYSDAGAYLGSVASILRGSGDITFNSGGGAANFVGPVSQGGVSLVRQDRAITAGSYMTGGGNLAADRSLGVDLTALIAALSLGRKIIKIGPISASSVSVTFPSNEPDTAYDGVALFVVPTGAGIQNTLAQAQSPSSKTVSACSFVSALAGMGSWGGMYIVFR